MRLHANLRAALLAAATSSFVLATGQAVRAQAPLPAGHPPVAGAPGTPAAGAPAAGTPAAGTPAAGAAPAGDPVVARVNGQDIHLSEVQEAAQGVPPQLRNLPSNVLVGMLVEQLIDMHAAAVVATKRGLDKDPAVAHEIDLARSQVLQNALLQKDVGPQINLDSIKARYDRDYANKPGDTEVHARHILVATEDAATKIIADLKKGGDFLAIAKAQSTDPGSSKDGGDLGFFKKGDMVPEFSEVAFSLKAGQVSDKPVHTQFGWHVIKVEEIRQAPPKKLEEVQEPIREQLIQEGVRAEMTKVRAEVKIEKLNPDGSVQKPLDTAEPPPAKK